MKTVLWGVLWLWSSAALADASLVVDAARVRETLPAQTVSSAYFTLRNTGSTEAVLVGVGSDRSARVEMHAHLHADGMMQMRAVDAVTVPAGGRVVFEPGAFHLMLLALPAPLKAGERVHLELRFADGRTLGVDAPVQPLQAMMPAHHRH